MEFTKKQKEFIEYIEKRWDHVGESEAIQIGVYRFDLSPIEALRAYKSIPEYSH